MIRTIGHSTHEPEEFIARCRNGGVKTILDIRSHPRSKWEWFNREQMDPTMTDDSWLVRAGIGYLWVPALGGWTARHLDQTLIVHPGTGLPLATRRMPDGGHTAAEVKLVDWAQKQGVDVESYSRGYFPKGRIAAQTGESGHAWTNQGLYDYAWYTALPEFQNSAEWLIRESQAGHTLQAPALMCAEFLWWKCHRSMVADYLAWKGVAVTHLQPTMTLHTRALGNRWDRYPQLVRDSWGPGGSK